jgi:vancomycin resistance protein VanJ
VIVLAVAYPAALIVTAMVMRLIGEGWWVSGVALYLPRIGFALPLPVIVPLLFVFRLRRLLWTQLVALLVILFPLMGLVLPWPTLSHKDVPTLRLLSFNVNSGFEGNEKIDAYLREFSPDIIVLQEVGWEADKLAGVLRDRYPAVEAGGQFIVASRFPILEVTDPDRLPYFGRMRSPRFMRYLVDGPLGRFVLYNVHPVSPRGVFYELRGRGLRREILSGHIFSGDKAFDMQENSSLRALQIQAVADLAARDTYPVVLAGDLNLPGLSSVFAKNLSAYQDGFARGSSGFGYTFPSRRPWMRLDRVLAGEQMRFVEFQVGCKGASDHLCVVADLQRREP